MRYQAPFPDEVRERAVRLVFEQRSEHASEWSAIRSVAEKIGCTNETLRNGVLCRGRHKTQLPSVESLIPSSAATSAIGRPVVSGWKARVTFV